MKSPAERLELLRESMIKHGIDTYIIFSEDEHQCEYCPACAERRQYISGFDGSAGTAIVTLKKAFLWTDGRYHIQAEAQLDSELWTLMKAGLPNVPSIEKWLQTSEEVQHIGYDPKLISIRKHKDWTKLLEAPIEKKIKLIDDNLVDAIWELDGKPARPRSKIVPLSNDYCGKSVAQKLNDLRQFMRDSVADIFVTQRLDEIAWITNLRGDDIAYCPLFLSYLLVIHDSARLYINTECIESIPIEELRRCGIECCPYDDFLSDLKRYQADGQNKYIIMDFTRTQYSCYQQVDQASSRILDKPSPIAKQKAIKNEQELKSMQFVHIKDACAKITFLAWLSCMQKTSWDTISKLTEVSLASKLDHLRSLMEDSKGPSFATISSLGKNSAIVHHKATENNCLPVSRDIYLVDSGGQYIGGTTDVTRTIHLGTPKPFQKFIYTLVLKGHLSLKHQRFPVKTRGSQLDALARSALWDAGYDYSHGTGHGVGLMLNVHEDPPSISPQGRLNEEPLQPGMIVSIEPGCYFEDEFGVRIENLVFVKEYSGPKRNLSNVKLLEFEDLTLIPYEKSLIDLDLLTEKEKKYIDLYHEKIFQTLQAHTELFERMKNTLHPSSIMDWLKAATEPLCV